MDKQLFDLAIGEAPPSTVDVDDVVARERRMVWVYRAANPWTGTATAVVVLAVGIAVFLAPGMSGGYIAPAASGTPSQVPVTTPTPTPTGCGGAVITAPPTSEAPSAAVARLTTVLKEAVLHHSAPGTTLEANARAEYPKGTPHGPLEFFHVSSQVTHHPNGGCGGGEDYFSGMATTALAAQKGNVRAVIGRLGGNASPSTECGQPPVDMQETCVSETGAGGETVVKTTMSRTGGGGPTIHRVDVAKTDGTGVILYAENVDTDAKYGGQPTSPAPPLTLDQLAAIALDPKVTLYP